MLHGVFHQRGLRIARLAYYDSRKSPNGERETHALPVLRRIYMQPSIYLFRSRRTGLSSLHSYVTAALYRRGGVTPARVRAQGTL